MTLQQVIERIAEENGYQIEAMDLDGVSISLTEPIPDDIGSIRLIRMVGSPSEWRPSETFTIDDIDVHIDVEVRAH